MAETNVQRLIRLAKGKLYLTHAIETAVNCIDQSYLIDSKETLEWYTTRLNDLKETCTPEEIQEAQTFTNAPI